MDFNYVSSCWFYNDLLYVYSDVFRLCLSHFGPNNLKLLLVVNDNSSKVSISKCIDSSFTWNIALGQCLMISIMKLLLVVILAIL